MNLRSGIVALLLVILGPTGPITAHAGQGSKSNFVNCISASFIGCNPDLLTDVERTQVRQADLQRNFINCISASFIGCNRNLLTDVERTQVRQADLQRNFVNCISASFIGCSRDLLTDTQRSAVTAARETPARTVRTRRCAENGSCSGDISTTTERPKTVHVNGYYRRDGTYVRGHYRSRPRR